MHFPAELEEAGQKNLNFDDQNPFFSFLQIHITPEILIIAHKSVPVVRPCMIEAVLTVHISRILPTVSDISISEPVMYHIKS